MTVRFESMPEVCATCLKFSALITDTQGLGEKVSGREVE